LIQLVLPRYVLPKRLASGHTAFYWTCPVRYAKAGCPWRSAALGQNLSQSELDEAAEVWNIRFDEWLAQRFDTEQSPRPIDGHFRHGTIGWLLDHYLTSEAFLQRVGEFSRPDYRRVLKRVCEIDAGRMGGTIGGLMVNQFGVKGALHVYKHFTDAGAMRTGEKALIYCKSVWERMRPHHPTLFRTDVPNPWEGVTKKRREQKKKTHVTRQEVYAFARGAIAKKKPELGAAAVLAFEWFMRPSSIADGYAQWSGYRPATHPDKIMIRHRKNGGAVNHPLEAVIDGRTELFYAEAEEVLSKVDKRGLSIVTKPDGSLYGGSTMLPTAIRELAEDLGMKGFTLDRARHGGMTEIEEANLTEGQGKALSTHRTKAYQVYAKETDKRVLNATLQRFGHSESSENPSESMAIKSLNKGKQS
jgi:hypothetical protein